MSAKVNKAAQKVKNAAIHKRMAAFLYVNLKTIGAARAADGVMAFCFRQPDHRFAVRAFSENMRLPFAEHAVPQFEKRRDFISDFHKCGIFGASARKISRKEAEKLPEDQRGLYSVKNN